MPPAAELERYENLSPGIVEWMKQKVDNEEEWFRQEQDHRQDEDRADRKLRSRGQVIAAAVVAAFTALTLVAIAASQPAVAIARVGAIAAVAGLFILKQRGSRSDGES